jgi:hypothetical protein
MTQIPQDEGSIPEIPVVTDIMIDLETLGVKPNCPVLAISAITFNRAAIKQQPNLSVLAGPQERTVKDYISYFNSLVSLLDCLAVGCEIEKNTANFWKKQPDRSILVSSMAHKENLAQTLVRLKDFLQQPHESTWAKSPRFDISIINSLAEACDVKLDIDFRKEDDVRTEIRDYPQFDVREISKNLTVLDAEGNKLGLHNPDYDCIVQIQAIQEVYAAKFPN